MITCIMRSKNHTISRIYKIYFNNLISFVGTRKENFRELPRGSTWLKKERKDIIKLYFSADYVKSIIPKYTNCNSTFSRTVSVFLRSIRLQSKRI